MDQQEQANPLGMSDEAIMEMDLTSPAPQQEEAYDDESQETETAAATEQEETAAHDDDQDGDSAESADAGDMEPAEDGADSDDTDPDTEVDPAEEEEEDAGDVDYKAAYEQIMAPFKANGKTIQVKSAADAIQLMQQGANYNKKMAALKPSLKVLKTLENNGLLDEGKLNYLIDLDKKNPEAIAKLVKESGLDPLDINTDEDSAYKPNSYSVDEREMALNEILEEIQDNPHYQQTMTIVGNQWDKASRQVIVDNPEIIKAINGHVESGVYAKIAEEIERERMFGRLEGMSDIQAYKTVGDRLHAEGAFNDANPKQKLVTPPVKKPEDPKLQQRRKAAGVTKTKAAKTAPVDFNPLTLSDAEFEKQFSSQYL